MKTTHLVLGTLVLALAGAACCLEAIASDVDFGIKTPETRKADFVVEMSGMQQVPMVATDASGIASFWINGNRTEIRFELKVNNLKNATMAHLHLGAAGKDGPPIVWLYRAAPSPINANQPFTGLLSQGTLQASDLSGQEQGKSINDLLAEIEKHGVYVNVHTQGQPDGEIRGQLP